MDARELLISWPGLERLDAAAILSHPAWRMPIGYEDDGMSLVLDAVASPRPDELLLAITLDDVGNVLGISDSPSYPDLHRLWARRDELPEALVVALIEKEAGTLLQAVEKATRRELRIVGLAESVGGVSRRSFRFETPSGASAFSLGIPADIESVIGVLDNLDPSHGSILTLSRPIRAEYVVIDAAPEAVSALKPGDFLIEEHETVASWQTELPDDSYLRFRDETDESATFAEFVSETLPPVPPPTSFAVYWRGHKIANAQTSSVGDSPAYKITALC